LQSEDYRIRQQTITLVGNKATGLKIAPVDLQGIVYSENDVSKKHLEEGKQAKILPQGRRRKSEADDG